VLSAAPGCASEGVWGILTGTWSDPFRLDNEGSRIDSGGIEPTHGRSANGSPS